jgi:hypothetical protein
MLRFLVDNWLAILSMIVAIAGGVPGILAFIEYFKDKPGFAFIVANWITGEIDGADHTRQPFIFLACTIANPGKQPLSPSHFELVLKVGRTRYGAERC